MTTVSDIRRADARDAESLSALMRDTFVSANGHCSSPANVALFLDTVYRPAIQAREIADPDIDTLLVERDGALAGYAQLRWSSVPPPVVGGRRPVELGRIYFLRQHHGKGLASALMDALAVCARRRGADTIWLNVWQQARQAIAFYRKQNFRIIGESIFMVGGDPKRDWVMLRNLEGA